MLVRIAGLTDTGRDGRDLADVSVIGENIQHLVQPLPLELSLSLQLLLANNLPGPSSLRSRSPKELGRRHHHDLTARCPAFFFASLSALLLLLGLQAGTAGG